MRLLAIDPGGVTGAVLVDTDTNPPRIVEVWTATSLGPLLSVIFGRLAEACVIEDIVNYGNPMGASTRETLKKIGEVRLACRRSKVKYHELARPDVNEILCHGKVSKGVVNQVVRDMYPQTGGGAKPAVGTKDKPGPLYCMKKAPGRPKSEGNHAWDALALAVAWNRRRPRTPGERAGGA
jgi:hypothetical protein